MAVLGPLWEAEARRDHIARGSKLSTEIEGAVRNFREPLSTAGSTAPRHGGNSRSSGLTRGTPRVLLVNVKAGEDGAHGNAGLVAQVTYSL